MLFYGLILTARGKVRMIQQNLYYGDDEVSVLYYGDDEVKRILYICVDSRMIYMLRMHWPFLMEFRVVSRFLRGKKSESDQSIIGDVPLNRSIPKPSCSLMVTTFLPEKALKSKKSLLQIPSFDHKNSLSKTKYMLVLLKVCCS